MGLILKPRVGLLPRWNNNPADIPSPVGAWIMGEGSGGKTYDVSGNAIDGTISGATWVPGKTGSALEFAGGEYVDCGNSSLLNVTVDPKLTFVFRINFHQIANQEVFFCRGLWNTDGYYIQQFDGAGGSAIEVYSQESEGGQGSRTSDGTLTTGWHHIAIVMNGTGSASSIYIDGIEPSYEAEDVTANILTSARNAYIGQYEGGLLRFDGLIEYVMIYNQVLTLAQVAYLYQHPYYAWEYPELWEMYAAAAPPVGVVPQAYMIMRG